MSDKPTRREHLQAKIDRAHAARIKAEQFIDAEEDLNSREAGVCLDFMRVNRCVQCVTLMYCIEQRITLYSFYDSP